MKITINGCVVCQKYPWSNEFSYSYLAFEPKYVDSNYIVVMEHSFDLEIPDDFDPRTGQIAALKKQKEEAQAAFSKRVMEIDDQINKLLAIEA